MKLACRRRRRYFRPSTGSTSRRRRLRLHHRRASGNERKGSAAMRLVAPLGLLAILSSAQAALATPSARLVYTRSEDAASCPDEAALRKAVETRFGYDPFFAWARQTVVAQISREGARYVARVQLVDEQGLARGTRELRSDEDDCAEVFDAAALAISIALDASATPTAPDPPTPNPPPPRGRTHPPAPRSQGWVPYRRRTRPRRESSPGRRAPCASARRPSPARSSARTWRRGRGSSRATGEATSRSASTSRPSGRDPPAQP